MNTKVQLNREGRAPRVPIWLLVFLCVLCVCARVTAQTPIRISGDSAIRYNAGVIDSNTLQSVQWVRGDAITIEAGLFDRGVFVSNSIARFTNINFELFQSQSDTNPPMMSLSVTNGNGGWNTNCNLANWTNGPTGTTNQDVVFVFTDAQTSIPLNGQASQSYWMRIYGVTTDAVPHVITYLESLATIYDGPMDSTYSAPAWTGFVTVNNSGGLSNPVNFFTENVVLIEDALLAAGFSGGGGGGNSTVLAGTNISIAYTLVGTNNEPVVSVSQNVLTNGERSTIVANGGIVNNGTLLDNGSIAATGPIGTSGAMYANGFTNVNSTATNIDTAAGRTNTIAGATVEKRDSSGNLTLAGQINANAAGLYGTIGASVAPNAIASVGAGLKATGTSLSVSNDLSNYGNAVSGTDCTLAMSNACLSGLQVSLPEALMLVAPTNTFLMKSGTSLIGHGTNSIVQIAGGIKDWGAMFGTNSGYGSISNITFADFVIDCNAAGNPNVNICNNSNQEEVADFWSSSGITFRNMIIRYCGVHAITLGANSATQTNLNSWIENCQFYFSPNSSAQNIPWIAANGSGYVSNYDNTAIYEEGIYGRVLNCFFYNDTNKCGWCFSGVEGHGSFMDIIGCTFQGYQIPVWFVSGGAASDNLPVNNDLVLNCKANDCSWGVALDATAVGPLNGIKILGSDFTINNTLQSSWMWSNSISGLKYFGVGSLLGGYGVNGVDVEGCTFRFTDESSRTYTNFYTNTVPMDVGAFLINAGIPGDGAAMEGATNWTIANNTVYNCPGMGEFWNAAGGAYGKSYGNRFINVGHNTQSGAYRALVYTSNYVSLSIESDDYIDNGAGLHSQYFNHSSGAVFANGNPAASGLTRFAASPSTLTLPVDVSGATTTFNGSTLNLTTTGAGNAGFEIYTGPSGTYLVSGSGSAGSNIVLQTGGVAGSVDILPWDGSSAAFNIWDGISRYSIALTGATGTVTATNFTAAGTVSAGTVSATTFAGAGIAAFQHGNTTLSNIAANWSITSQGYWTNTAFILTNNNDQFIMQPGGGFAAAHAGTNVFSADATNGVNIGGLLGAGTITATNFTAPGWWFTNFGTMAFNHYYTNTWGHQIHVTVQFNSTGAQIIDADYIFCTNAINSSYVAPADLINIYVYNGPNTIKFDLGPGDYCAITNGDAGVSSIHTNKIQVTPF